MHSAGWLKYGLLAVLAAGGGAGGLYFSGAWPGETLPILEPQDAAINEPPAPLRFPLSTLDARDTVEAPDVAAGPNGTVYLAWASKTVAAERTVFFTRSLEDGSFAAPRAISRAGIYKSKGSGKNGGFERRALPHLAAHGDTVEIAWSEALPDHSAMRMVLATSTDAGRSFGTPIPVHSGANANPTFTAISANAAGALACTWLDDRSGVQLPFAALRRAADGDFAAEQQVYAGQNGKGVCPCCPTASCFGPDGTFYAAFRNVNDGYRDMAVCRMKAGQAAFEGPFPVIPNTWKFDGCPHDGPSLVVTGTTLHIVWMDARSGPQRCYYARANTADMRFTSRELHPSGPGTQGNPKLGADSSGGVYAVWEESLGAEPPAAASGHAHGPPKLGGSGRAVLAAYLPAGASEFGPAAAVAPRPGASNRGRALPWGLTAPCTSHGWNWTNRARPWWWPGCRGGVRHERRRNPIPVAHHAISGDYRGGSRHRGGRRLGHQQVSYGFASLSRSAFSWHRAPVAGSTERRGDLLFQVHCAACHGPDGRGDGASAAALHPPPRDFAMRPWRFAVSAESIRKIILEGIPGTAMASFQPALAAADVDRLTKFTLHLATSRPASPYEPSEAERLLKEAGFIDLRGAEPPALTVSDAAGTDVRLADLKGRVVLVHFWGTACVHCLQEMPQLHALEKEYAGRGLTVLHVCTDVDDVGEAQRIAGRTAPGIRVFAEESGLGLAGFEVQALPAVWLIGADGKAIGRSQGARDWKAPALLRLIDRMLLW